MTTLRVQAGDVPSPEPSWVTQPFWDGIERGELLVQQCESCGGVSHTPALVCSACGVTDLVWVESSGRGVIKSWTVVWQAPTADFSVPYAPVIVRLEEGWDMLSSMVWCEPDQIEIGKRVEVLFQRRRGRPTLPYFRLVGDGETPGP